jgi:hypothetical protein
MQTQVLDRFTLRYEGLVDTNWGALSFAKGECYVCWFSFLKSNLRINTTNLNPPPSSARRYAWVGQYLSPPSVPRWHVMGRPSQFYCKFEELLVTDYLTKEDNLAVVLRKCLVTTVSALESTNFRYHQEMCFVLRHKDCRLSRCADIPHKGSFRSNTLR